MQLALRSDEKAEWPALRSPAAGSENSKDGFPGRQYVGAASSVPSTSPGQVLPSRHSDVAPWVPRAPGRASHWLFPDPPPLPSVSLSFVLTAGSCPGSLLFPLLLPSPSGHTLAFLGWSVPFCFRVWRWGRGLLDPGLRGGCSWLLTLCHLQERGGLARGCKGVSRPQEEEKTSKRPKSQERSPASGQTSHLVEEESPIS